MKKFVSILIVVGIMALTLCGAAVAVEADPPYTQVADGVDAVITLQTGNEKVDATYNDPAVVSGGQYMFYLVKKNSSEVYFPTETTVIYMNQTSASVGGTVSFTGMYPEKLEDCAVMVSGTGLAAPKVIGYVVVPLPPYTLGDVNEDDGIDGLDASVILRYVANYAELTDLQKLAGDVDGNGAPDGLDASWILRYVAFKVELEDFPAAKN